MGAGRLISPLPLISHCYSHSRLGAGSCSSRQYFHVMLLGSAGSTDGTQSNFRCPLATGAFFFSSLAAGFADSNCVNYLLPSLSIFASRSLMECVVDASPMPLLAQAEKLLLEQPLTRERATQIELLQESAIGAEATQFEVLWARAYALYGDSVLTYLCDSEREP